MGVSLRGFYSIRGIQGYLVGKYPSQMTETSDSTHYEAAPRIIHTTKPRRMTMIDLMTSVLGLVVILLGMTVKSYMALVK